MRIKRGNPYQASITLTGLDGQPLNLTDVTVLFTVRSLTDKALDDTAALIKQAITDHYDPGNGRTYLNLSAEQTAIQEGTYVGDIRAVGSELQQNTNPFLIEIEQIITTRQDAPAEQETMSLLERMAVQPSIPLIKLIDKTIVDLKSSGIWAKTEKFHKWDLHTEQASLLDWKNAAFDAATSGTGSVFTPGTGLQTNPDGHIELNIIPSADCTIPSLNNFAFSLDDISGQAVIAPNFGAFNHANDSHIIFRTKESDANPRPWLYLNSAIPRVWNNNAGINLYYCERATADAIAIYKDPLTLTLGIDNPSVSMVDNSLVLGGARQSNETVKRNPIKSSTFWLGSVLTLEERTAYYEIINYWKAHVGATI